MTTKVIYYKPFVFSTCKKCPYSKYVPYPKPIFSTKILDLYFCTYGRYYIKTLPNKYPKYKILKCANNKESTYVYLENPDVIPNWCPMEDFGGEEDE